MDWIGLWEVRSAPHSDTLEGGAGAFVNIVALSKDEEQFRHLVEISLRELGLEVLNTKDVQTVRDRESSSALNPEITRLIAVLTEEYPIQFDEFQAYPNELRTDRD